MNKFVVLQRFNNGKTKYLTLIMILNDRTKAEALADFLNAGGYFESPVTVEGADANLPNDQIVSMLSRTL